MIIRHKTCHVRDPASLNYLLDGGLKTCVGVHSACFEVLNLYAGVSQFDSGFKPLEYSAHAYRGLDTLSPYGDGDGDPSTQVRVPQKD